MFSHIRTSKENKDVVTELTRKFSLGSENHIARIALAYSIENHTQLDIKDIKDSGGKEYSKTVLFGDFSNVYIGMICTLHGIDNNDKNISKYIKAHLDDGLLILSQKEIPLEDLFHSIIS